MESSGENGWSSGGALGRQDLSTNGENGWSGGVDREAIDGVRDARVALRGVFLLGNTDVANGKR